MPCEQYKDALIEAAAGGRDLADAPGSSPELHTLRLHLESCASCRAAFAQEQSLFAAIDTGLHAAANPEVPPSLLPRVRVALEQEVPFKRNWFSDALVLATASGIVLALFTMRMIRPTKGSEESVNTAVATRAPLPLPVPAQGQGHTLFAESTAKANVLPTSGIKNASRALPGIAPATAPEVLVPKDQEALLVSYAEQWHLRKRAPLVAADVVDATLEPLQVAPIQIAQLDVKLLAEGNLQ
jgi:hypothetical protein